MDAMVYQVHWKRTVKARRINGFGCLMLTFVSRMEETEIECIS